MRPTSLAPALIGCAMALMFLWMGHDTFMAGTGGPGRAGLLFILMHVGALLGMAVAAFFVPGFRGLARAHRPSARHLAVMLLAMGTTLATSHVILHGTGIA